MAEQPLGQLTAQHIDNLSKHYTVVYQAPLQSAGRVDLSRAQHWLRYAKNRHLSAGLHCNCGSLAKIATH